MAARKQRTCFVVGPIGEEGSDERRNADWLLEEIVKPVLESEQFNYKVQRADEFPDPGMITDQALTSAMDADLVVADLTDRNPNAFYELAVRHMVQKPIIHMVQEGETIPFDVKDYRTIQYSIRHPTDLKKARTDLARQVEATEKAGYEVSNPITKVKGRRSLAVSSDPRDRIIADMTTGLSRLEARFSQLEKSVFRSVPLPAHLVPPVGSLHTLSASGIGSRIFTVFPPDPLVAEASSEHAGESDDENDQSGSAKSAQETSSSREKSDDGSSTKS